MRTHVSIRLVLALQLLSASGAAMAQAQSQPASNRNSGPAARSALQDAPDQQSTSALERSLDEVVVTGRKRDVAERAQDVPIALSAFSAGAIEAAHVKDLSDIGNLAPSVRLMPSGSVPGYGSFFIRGAGVAGSIPSNDPAVGTFIDGMPLGVSSGSLTELFDLASIEVLRGPQGTLFGRNVTGGAILVRTARPTGDLHANLRGALGSHGQQELTGSVEGGVAGGAIAVKLAFLTKHSDGFFKDVATGDRLGERDVQIVRPTVVFHPTDKLTIAVIGEIGEDSGDGPVAKNLFVPGTSVTNSGFIPPPGKFDVGQNTRGYNDLAWKHAIINVDWDVGPGKITSITGWRGVTQAGALDADGSSFGAIVFDTNIDQSQFFQELRFAGKPFGTDAINITAGVSVLDQDFTYDEGRFIFSGALRQALRGTIDHKQYGAFGQADVALPWNVTITAGARYSYERKAAAIASLGNCNFERTTCVTDFRGKDAWRNLGPKLGLQWRPSDTLQVYASWTRGFRSGGFNIRNGSPLISAGPYDEETADAYEVGLKSELFDRRVRVNLAAFVNKAKDLQQVVLNQSNQQTVLNAADATVKGFEAELNFLPARGLVLTGSAGYVDNAYDRFDGLDVNADRIPDPDIARRLKFAQVPKWTASSSATYETSVGSLGTLTLRGSYTYVSSRPADVINNFDLEAYELIDASAALALNKYFTLTLYGKNLTNALYAGFGAAVSLYRAILPSPPRTWLVEASVRF